MMISNCRNLLVLRFLAFNKRLLHRDVSWSNILLNPRRIGGANRAAANEQPKSFAQFEKPGHKAVQDDMVFGVKSQQLGTVALLDLELAAKLDPTEGAKEGVDATVN